MEGGRDGETAPSLFDSGFCNITCHERPWERLLSFSADCVHGSFVLLICACEIKLGFIYLLLVLGDEEQWEKE